MNILFLSGRELSYPRNGLIFNLLSSENSVRFIGRQTGAGSILLQSILGVFKAIPLILSRRFSLCYIGFFGQIIMIPLGTFRKQKFIFDAFISTYDTLCFDRRIFSPGSPAGRLAHWLDKTACKLATRVIVDTHAHAAFFEDEFCVPAEKVDVLFVGCDDNLFVPLDIPPQKDLVLFYGSYLPLHGLEIILEAARKVEKARPAIRFRLIGPRTGQSSYPYLSSWNDLKNIEWKPSVPIAQLPAEIQQAAICLGGHFGTSQKAGRVIAGKTFQCIAMGKPTIVGDNPANRELLEHGKDAWFCQMGDPDALANATLTLMDDPELCKKLGLNARKTYLSKASNPILEDDLKKIVLRTMND